MKYSELQKNNANKLLILKNCKSPIVIFNKAVIPLLLNRCCFFENENLHRLSYNEVNELSLHSEKTLRKISYMRKLVQHDTNRLLDFYCVDRDGCRVPLFTLVGCGKCLSCRNRKVNDLQVRAICESITSSTRPISIVLTYNDGNLPKDGVNKEEVQLFLKRLRIELSRKYRDKGYKDNLRYFCVAEYGEKRKRAHYHIVFWNFPKFAEVPEFNLKHIKEFLEDVWSLGFVKIKYTDEPLQGNAKASVKAGVQYCVKYLNKDSYIPYRYVTEYDPFVNRIVRRQISCNKPFLLMSRGRGKVQGLGSEWLFENAEWLQNNLTATSSYTWKYNKESKTATLPAYFIDKLWPTISRIVPKEVRDSFALFNAHIPFLKTIGMEYLIERMRVKYWFLPQPQCFTKYNSDTLSTIFRLVEILDNYKVSPKLTEELLRFRELRTQVIADSLYNKDYPTGESYEEYYEIFFSNKPKYNYILDDQ